MKPKKKFDCVEMKNAVQNRLVKERRSVGDREFERRHREWLETSDDPLARWWRRLKEAPAQRPSRAARG